MATAADLLVEMIRREVRAHEALHGRPPRVLALPDADVAAMRAAPNEHLYGEEGAALTHAGRAEWHAFLRRFFADRFGLEVRFGAAELTLS